MLEARSLAKYYSHTAAVRGVSFSIKPGEVLGYLGPNGAGKSTTVKMLTGLIEPSEGQIFYRGRTVYDDFPAFQRQIGYVPEEAHLYPHLSGWEYLQLVGRLRSIPRQVLEPRIEEFFHLFSLWDDRHDLLSSYSKGMRQKVLLSAAVLHNPEILILDEPFSGLDVTSSMVLRSLIRNLAEQGKMILYSSHVLEVVEKVCSQVLILRKGEVVAHDSIGHLRDLMSQPSLEGVFAQLAQVEDGDAVARRIVHAMGDAPPPSAPPPPAVPSVGPPQKQSALSYFADFAQDVKYAARMLAKSPGFTAVALISLSLGACIATCALSEMYGLVWREVPVVAKPAELVATQLPVSYPDYQRYRDQTGVFASTAAWMAPTPLTVTLGGRTERYWGHLVTPSYFPTLGVRPTLGSFFQQAHDHPGDTPSVVVSYNFWQAHLRSDPSVIGKSLRINGQAAILIGVGPPGFFGPSPVLYRADLWMPLADATRVAPELAGNPLEHRDRAILRFTGRLKPGVTLERAEAALDTVARKIEEDAADPDRNRPGRRIALLDAATVMQFRKQDKPFFASFFVLVAALMVFIPCTNIASMMLARATNRRREIAVRLALGASRARLIRHLLAESLIVAALSGALGFFGSVWLMHGLSQLRMPFASPIEYNFQADWRVMLCALGLMAFTGLAFGLMPALQATRTDVLPALKEGGTLLVRRNRRFNARNLLVISQIAGTLMLLTLIGFESFGIQTTLGVQQGFDPRNLFMVTLDPVRDGFSGQQSAALLDKLLDRVKALPSVTAASLTESVPVSIQEAPVRVLLPSSANERTLVTVRRHVVGRDYFATTGIPILHGREFLREDEMSDAAKIVVSETLAHEFWPGSDPLGRTIEITQVPKQGAAGMFPSVVNDQPGALAGGRRIFEVVGVARDVAEGLTVQKPKPLIYFSLSAADYRQPALSGITLIMRAIPGADVLTAAGREIAAIDPRLTPFDGQSMHEHIERFMVPLQVASWSYGTMWAFGLVLAAVGLAGVTAYSVTQRRHEIGIRLALGAEKRHVLGLVMKDGVILIAAGIGFGLIAAAAATRLLAAMNATAGQVTSTSTSNPIVLVGAPLLLSVLALVACYLPARRSLQVDPVEALREE
jgi:predicted permease